MPTAVENIFSNSFAIESLHPEVQGILIGLNRQFGGKISIISSDDDWLNFEVLGMTNEVLFQQIEERHRQIFWDKASNFQVLFSPRDPASRGLFLHYLSTPALRSEYIAGVWTY